MAEVALPVQVPSLKAKPIIREQLTSSRPATHSAFNPERHLTFSEQPKILSLKDLNVPEDAGLSPVGISDPFPLFSEEAMKIMREEIFTNDVWDHCLQSSGFASCQLRGHCPKYAPFMYDAWKHPKTLSIISKVAGIDLIPVFDLEIGNINVSVQEPEEDPAGAASPLQKEAPPVTEWHKDSYPFVCVVMMSDTSNMVGGETAVQTGAGEILKVRGPQMGSAIVLQGRCISHQALGAIGGNERITMVTAFRPKDPFVQEDSDLTTIRRISPWSELFFQWTEYRIEVLQDRLRGMLKLIQEQHRAGKQTDAKRIKEFLQLQEEWLSRTNREIVAS